MKKNIFSVAIFALLLLPHCSNINYSIASEKETLHSQSNKKKIYFGILPDAYPISSYIQNSNEDYEFKVEGYCGELIDFLNKRLTDGDKQYEIVYAEIDYLQRFTGYGFHPLGAKEKKKVEVPLDIECGPNTKTLSRIRQLKTIDKRDYQGHFHDEHFFETGTKVLIKKTEAVPFEKSTIAVIGSNKSRDKPPKPVNTELTTTEALIAGIYPQAKIRYFSDRKEIVKEFKRIGTYLDGYVSDEILLKGMIKHIPNRPRPSLATLENLKDYHLYPRLGWLSYDRYAIVYYDRVPELEWSQHLKAWHKSIKGKQAKERLESFQRDNFLIEVLQIWSSKDLVGFWFLFGSILVLLSLFMIHPIFLALLVTLMPHTMSKLAIHGVGKVKPNQSVFVRRLLWLMFNPISYCIARNTKRKLRLKIIIDAISNLPSSTPPTIKEPLAQMVSAIASTELDDADEAIVLKQVELLTEVAETSDGKSTDSKVIKNSSRVLESVSEPLTGLTSFMEALRNLMSEVSKWNGGD